ncbi:MAG TPA: amidohydrolase [Chitinophagaceae bacterium]|nr:amidohydrolase [Chitinophagaceae bacterium]
MNESITIAGIQANLHWEDRDANLEMFESKIRSISTKPSVVVLPEMFSTGFSMNPAKLAETMDGPTVQWMKQQAAEMNCILTGSVIIHDPRHDADGREAWFNRLLWVLPNGDVGYYDKRHLFAYAGEDRHYQRGNKRLITSVNGWRFNALICYDLRFPVWARQRPPESSGDSPEYDVLIYVANWPERRIHAWKTLLQARAIENQCYVIGVNRVGTDGNQIHHSGESLVVDAMGEILYYKKDEEDIFSVILERERLEQVRQKLPFWKDADKFRIYEG